MLLPFVLKLVASFCIAFFFFFLSLCQLVFLLLSSPHFASTDRRVERRRSMREDGKKSEGQRNLQLVSSSEQQCSNTNDTRGSFARAYGMAGHGRVSRAGKNGEHDGMLCVLLEAAASC
jgi:hypothetical protein